MRQSKKSGPSGRDSPYNKKLFVNEPHFFHEEKYDNFIDGIHLKKPKEDEITRRAKNVAVVQYFFKKRNYRSKELATKQDKMQTPAVGVRPHRLMRNYSP